MRAGDSQQQQLISRLTSLVTVLENANRHTSTPLTDPSLNVKEVVEIERRHAAELRAADKQREDDAKGFEKEKDQLREQLRKAESDRIDAVNLAERNRIDANVAQGKADIALASEKAAATAITLASSVVNSAKALSDAAAATASLQDRRLTALEQNQLLGVGGKMQQAESRQMSQWVIGIVSAFGGAFILFMLSRLWPVH